MHTIVLIIIINQFYSKLSALARVCPRRGNLPKLTWVQYLADLIWSHFSLPNTHAYSANGNHSWLTGGGQAPQLFFLPVQEKNKRAQHSLPPSFLPITASSNSTASKQSQEKPLSGIQATIKTSGLKANKHPQLKPGLAMGLKSQTPYHSSSHTDRLQGQNQATLSSLPFPGASRSHRRGCSAWSSLKQTWGPKKTGGGGGGGTELPSLIRHSTSAQPFLCFTPPVVAAACFPPAWEYRKRQPATTAPWNKKIINTGWFTCMHYLDKHMAGTEKSSGAEKQHLCPESCCTDSETSHSGTWSRKSTSRFPVMRSKNLPHLHMKEATLEEHFKPFRGDTHQSLCKRNVDVFQKKVSYKRRNHRNLLSKALKDFQSTISSLSFPKNWDCKWSTDRAFSEDF